MSPENHQATAEALLAERGALRSLARALLHDVHLADDVVQDALVAALAAPQSRDRELRPWLRSTVRNLVWKRLERDRGRTWREEARARQTDEASVTSPEEQTARLEQHGLVVVALRELDEPYRSTLLLRFFEDRTPSEIARLQGVPAGTVRWRLKAGLDLLREQLDRRQDGGRNAWVSGLLPLLQPRNGIRETGLATSVFEGIRNMPLLAQLGVLSVPALTLTTALLLDPVDGPAEVATVIAVQPELDGGQETPTASESGRVQATGDTDPRTRPDGADDLVSDRLLAYARREIRAGWAAELGDEPTADQVDSLIDEYIDLLMTSPRSMGSRAADEYREMIAAGEAGGPVFEILIRLSQGADDPRRDIALDAKGFEKLFEPEGAGPTIDAQHPGKLSEKLVPGATLLLPPGVYRIDDLMDGEAFPRDVTLAGTGMNATLVFLEELSTRGPVVNLAFRDLTIHTDNDYLFDLRNQPASVRMDRVRLIGFDTGAGSSCAFGTEELALLARDCLFEGGYGRNPGSGNVFDVRNPGLLARFERCEFDLVELPFSRIRNGARVVLDSCRITRDVTWGGPASGASILESSSALRLIDTPVDYFYLPGERRQVPTRDLELLFPDWKSDLTR